MVPMDERRDRPSPAWGSGLPADAVEALFDAIPDVVFFVKDARGRYRVVNTTLAERLGRPKADLIGRLPEDVFPEGLGRAFADQDRWVVEHGRALRDRLELHVHADGGHGWCMTQKLPLRDAAGGCPGMVGISRDLPATVAGRAGFERVARAAARLDATFARPPGLDALAREVGSSPAQLRRGFHRAYGLGPRAYVRRLRIEAATALLRLAGEDTVASVAHACGYADHAAFTRAFRAAVGVTPRAYRIAVRSSDGA